MAALVLTTSTLIIGTAWTGTAPGPGGPTVSGTVTTDLALNDHSWAINIDQSVAFQDFTTFADAGFVVELPGLKSGQLEIEFNQDWAAANVDATFGAGFLAATPYYIDLKGTSSARGSTNPSYVYKAYVAQWQPIGQTVGDAAVVKVPFRVTGSFSRLTS